MTFRNRLIPPDAAYYSINRGSGAGSLEINFYGKGRDQIPAGLAAGPIADLPGVLAKCINPESDNEVSHLRNITFEHVGYSTYHVMRDGEFVGIVSKQLIGDRWKCGCPSVDLWFESKERAALVHLAIIDAMAVERPDVEIALGQVRAARVRVRQDLITTRDQLDQVIGGLDDA